MRKRLPTVTFWLPLLAAVVAAVWTAPLWAPALATRLPALTEYSEEIQSFCNIITVPLTVASVVLALAALVVALRTAGEVAHRPPRLPRPPRRALAPHGPLPPGSHLPFLPNPLFTGREPDLLALTRHLLPREPHLKALWRRLRHRPQSLPVPLVLHGIAGMGKTQLAVEFAFRYGRFFHGVHWLNAANPSDLDAQIAACGADMALSPWPEKEPEQVAATLRAWQSPGPRLVILDNTETPADAQSSLARLAGLPLAILLTSRFTAWPSTLGLEAIPLREFSPEDSRAFLRRYLPPDRATQGELDQLAERLGHLPLALELAGRYLATLRSLTIPAYLDSLQAIWSDPSMVGWRRDLPSPTDHELHLAATFAVSWKQVSDPSARQLFLSAGWCAATHPIPCALLQAAAHLESAPCDGALALLSAFGLLQHDPSASTVSLHPLLADYARAHGGATAALPPLAYALARLSTAALNTGLPTHYAPLRPHLESLAPQAEKAGNEDAAALWNNLGRVLQALGDLPAARKCIERALAIGERALGPDHPTVATRVNNLGSILRALGDLPAARQHFQRALAIDEKTYGPDHPTVARHLNNLGLVLKDLGDFPTAGKYYERALRILEDHLPPGHPNIELVRRNLATLNHPPRP